MMSKITKYFKITFFRSLGSLPSILILYVTSKCNQKCNHCFYSASLNQKNDLELDDYKNISNEFGVIENLLIGGGEPFANISFSKILTLFYTNNQTKLFSIPTNATLLPQMEGALSDIRANCKDAFLNLYISFDGMENTHNEIRQFPNAFNRSMNNLDYLLKKFEGDSKIRFFITTTLMSENSNEIINLFNYVKNRFKNKVQFNMGLLRGEPKNPNLGLPHLNKISSIYSIISKSHQFDTFTNKIRSLAMFGLKMNILLSNKQVIQCKAGELIGVIYANGDVSSCELLPSVGNVLNGGFLKVWFSDEAKKQKRKIMNKECVCTHGCFLTPSITYSIYMPIFMIYFYIYAKKIMRKIHN